MKIQAPKWQKSKTKTLIYLQALKNSHGTERLATAVEIYVGTGVSYASLVSCLTKWTTIMHYVARRRKPFDDYRYCILAKGSRFLKWAYTHLPVQIYRNEIYEFQSISKPIYFKFRYDSARKIVREVEKAWTDYQQRKQ